MSFSYYRKDGTLVRLLTQSDYPGPPQGPRRGPGGTSREPGTAKREYDDGSWRDSRGQGGRAFWRDRFQKVK